MYNSRGRNLLEALEGRLLLADISSSYSWQPIRIGAGGWADVGDVPWEAAEREFRRALTLNPNYAFAHDQFGMALAFQGSYIKRKLKGSCNSLPFSP